MTASPGGIGPEETGVDGLTAAAGSLRIRGIAAFEADGRGGAEDGWDLALMTVLGTQGAAYD